MTVKKTSRKNDGAKTIKGKFNSNVQPIYEQVLNKTPLTQVDSTTLLLEGNKIFVRRLSKSHLTLAELSRRHIDELLFMCSDARAGLVLDLDLFRESNVVPIFSAGNVFPVDKKSTPHSTQIITNILELMGPDDKTGAESIIRIMGHEDCGAVKAAVRLKKEGDVGHLRDVLDLLTNEVSATDEKQNVLAQIEAARNLLWNERVNLGRFGKGIIFPSFFGWSNSENPVEGYDTSSYGLAFRRKAESGLVNGMDKHFAHAILITSVNDLDVRIPVDLRTLFGIEGPNEAFLVTAKWPLGGPLSASFDSIQKASILYALLHVGATNVVLVHHCTVVLDRWAGEVSMFLDSLKKSSNEQEKIIGEKFEEGTIGLTSLKVDMPSGAVLPYNP